MLAALNQAVEALKQQAAICADALDDVDDKELRKAARAELKELEANAETLSNPSAPVEEKKQATLSIGTALEKAEKAESYLARALVLAGKGEAMWSQVKPVWVAAKQYLGL